MTSSRLLVAFLAATVIPAAAQAVVIETVLVGNAGNAPDTEVMVQDGTTGYGAVPYEYRIGKYEVTKAQWVEFLNAVNPTGEGASSFSHKLGLYNRSMSTGGPNGVGGGIDFNASAPNGTKYSVRPGFENYPANWISWYAAIRFTNWLHNGQGSGDTETGAYTIGPFQEFGSDPINGHIITRNPGARWFLPSEDEWYKAAYHKNDGVTGNYWDYATRSDTLPTPEPPPGGTNSANFDRAVADSFTTVGAYPLSPGPYGTFDQAGNAFEWNEALIVKPHHLFPEIDVYFRGLRAGSASIFLPASSRPASGGEGDQAGGYRLSVGFRVATLAVIPEPGTLLLFTVGSVVIALGRRRFRLSVILCAAVLFPSAAQAVVIETVLVGNAGNAPDTEVMVQDGTTGYGAVPYEYRIGEYEVTNAQYTEFLNMVDPTGANTLHLYINNMSASAHGGINYNATAENGSKYEVKPGRDNHPVNWVSWYDVIRFANWLHNGQGNGDTETGAYSLGPLEFGSVPVNGNSITRNPGARWFLPSEDEWYKAAYHKNDRVTGNYWDYPTASDTPPTAETPPGGANSANFSGVVGTVSDVGAYTLSDGPYGTFDQGGNVIEWNEALIERGPASNPLRFYRGTRGSSWSGDGVTISAQFMAASDRTTISCDGPNPSCAGIIFGFRVATLAVIPEPGTLLLLAVGIALASLGRSSTRALRPAFDRQGQFSTL